MDSLLGNIVMKIGQNTHTHTHTRARARARLTMFIVTPALARCDIGVRFSVRPSVFPSTIYVDPSI